MNMKKGIFLAINLLFFTTQLEAQKLSLSLSSGYHLPILKENDSFLLDNESGLRYNAGLAYRINNIFQVQLEGSLISSNILDQRYEYKTSGLILIPSTKIFFINDNIELYTRAGMIISFVKVESKFTPNSETTTFSSKNVPTLGFIFGIGVSKKVANFLEIYSELNANVLTVRSDFQQTNSVTSSSFNSFSLTFGTNLLLF
ncbi:MAG: hypothetical protein SFU91_14020 [Chloroherpetonaceae bacterium]|nr:hypothetical protein [Chloroherpetonaceae bacterium]